MARSRHPKKDVEKALQFAEDNRWTVSPKNKTGGHTWGFMICPTGEDRASIWSTPTNEGNHANQLRRAVIRCDH